MIGPIDHSKTKKPASRTPLYLAAADSLAEQIADQAAHAVGLLPHQLEYPLSFRLGQLQVGHRFDETSHHRQGRANLMRDVGDEVAAHAIGAFPFGDVLRQNQALAIAVGPNQD